MYWFSESFSKFGRTITTVKWSNRCQYINHSFKILLSCTPIQHISLLRNVPNHFTTSKWSLSHNPDQEKIPHSNITTQTEASKTSSNCSSDKNMKVVHTSLCEMLNIAGRLVQAVRELHWSDLMSKNQQITLVQFYHNRFSLSSFLLSGMHLVTMHLKDVLLIYNSCL